MSIRAKIVNARHDKHVPGRKTDIGDAQWLATLLRAGLLRVFYSVGKNARTMPDRSATVKLVGQLAAKNRLHKILADGAIRLGVVVGMGIRIYNANHRHDRGGFDGGHVCVSRDAG